MGKRLFEIILISDSKKLEENNFDISTVSTIHTTFIIKDGIKFYENENQSFFNSNNDQDLSLSLEEIINFYEKRFDLHPTDIFIISDQIDSFVCELDKWNIELTSNPFILALEDEGDYRNGPIVFTYSHFLKIKNFFEWILEERLKINSLSLGYVETKKIEYKQNETSHKVYDCFVFNNEFDILELRLKLLSDRVEKFILVESKQTHSGISKPAFFQQNKSLFEEYSDKIINLVIEEFPEKMLYSPSEIDVPQDLHIHWFRENYQRNEILKGLYKIGLEPQDVVLISDLDEIPDPNKLDEFISMIPEDDYAFQLQKWCIWDFDRFHSGLWPGTAGIRWRTLCKSTPQEVRKNRYSENKLHTNEPFGWHCSWFGGIDAVMDKLKSFAHQELREMSKEDVETKMTMNLDIHGHQLIYDKEGYRPLI